MAIGARTILKRTRSRTGVRPNGVPAPTVMPYSFYHVFTERDLDAVVAYIRSVPAISNKVQAAGL